MIGLTNDEIDNVMSEVGMRLANETVGKSLDDDDVDDILAGALKTADKNQRYEVVDNMLDLLAISELVRQALSNDSQLDTEETEELVEYLNELESDTKTVMKNLVATH